MSLFKKLMDVNKTPEPEEAIAELEKYRGQGQDDAIDIMQKTLREEISGENQDLVEILKKAGG